ncbi:tetratricopeptide repeat protein [Agaribacterium haliotis]|uniref:tetratricopeptide repeat protein n=1 Tax=Agaribacterium haliotis TaxID=2013869 RepID=UPI000BB55D8F|nr:tetratricopeptide repeat protein [Agaribacterium haliotis]
MSCFKRYGLCLLAVLTLAACGGMAKKETPEQGEADTLAAPSFDTENFVAIARPAPEFIPVISDAAWAEFAEAKNAMLEQNWAEAETRLILMTQTYPELTGAYTNLAIVYGKQERLEEAEQAYRQAITGNAYNFDAYANLGVLLRSEGRFDDAEQVYLEALALWPHHQASLINLGVLYDLYMGRSAEALPLFITAQQLNDEPDRQLKGWIIDLQRRVKTQAPVKKTPPKPETEETPDAQLETEVESESEVEAEPEAEGEPEPEAGSEVGLESGADVESEAGLESEPEMPLEADAELKNEND